MTIDKMIEKLYKLREKLGGNEEVPVVRVDFGENDFIIPSEVVQGDFEDQDGRDFKCALIAKEGGEEFTEKGTPHYEWDYKKNILKT